MYRKVLRRTAASIPEILSFANKIKYQFLAKRGSLLNKIKD